MIKNELLRIVALEILPNQKAAPLSGEAWLYALEMTLLGMGMVFAVLAILWGVLCIFKLIFAKPNTKEEKASKEVKAEPTPAPKVESTSSPAPVAAANDDAELIAILTAAIVAYESEQNPNAVPGNFRVVSYRRANGGRAWNSK